MKLTDKRRQEIVEETQRTGKMNLFPKELEEQQQYKRELDGTQDVYTSQSAVEKIARDTLGLVKSNEKFFKNYNDNQ